MGFRRLIVEVPEGEEEKVKRLLMNLTSEVRGESLVVSEGGSIVAFSVNCTAYRASTMCKALRRLGVGKDFGIITIVPTTAVLPPPGSSGSEGHSYMTRLPAAEIHALILDQSGGNIDYVLLCLYVTYFKFSLTLLFNSPTHSTLQLCCSTCCCWSWYKQWCHDYSIDACLTVDGTIAIDNVWISMRRFQNDF